VQVAVLDVVVDPNHMGMVYSGEDLCLRDETG
jgi:hypothetical protein